LISVDVETLVIQDRDGRDLAVTAAGLSDGFPLLVHPGSPGSRVLYAPHVELAAEYGFRLLSYDRPGYGLSTSRPDRRVAHGAGDAATIADALGYERFATWGYSGGGPFALACAALLTGRVTAATVFASLGPHTDPGFDFAAERSTDFRDEIALFFTDQPAARRKYHDEGTQQLADMSEPDFWMTIWGDRAGTDHAHSQQLADHLAANTRQAARQGDQGWWEDWGAFLNPWGFDLKNIQRPVQLWHGEQDLAAPVIHGQWLAEHIPSVDAHILPGEDHSTIEINHHRDAMQWLHAHAQ
jgi:pimeloyl-ACP methyl ester carboxylesterase